MGRLRRFLHLERPRPAASSAATPDARRFCALEPRPLADGAAPLPASAADRFRAPEGSGLALDLAPDGEQPFVRCSACEADHGRHAVRCSRCGAALDTPEQRAFNDRLWEARRREAEEERRVAQARRDARELEDGEEARARRALARAMAEEIARREREREPWLARALAWLRARFPAR